MSPRSASVNEEMRRRSRERLLGAAVELVDERGYEGTTLADIADRAGSARGLVSYYFPGKRQLLQSAVHRLMHLEIAAALDGLPADASGDERLARAVDRVLTLALERPVLFRTHMAGLVNPEGAGFVQCPEQQRLAAVLEGVVAAWGAREPVSEYRMLRTTLMGAVFGLLLPGAPMPLTCIRAELFRRYGLDWSLGTPPEPWPPQDVRRTEL
jgi:AcrR family transcriptional regulator